MNKPDADDPIRLLSEPEFEEYLRRDSQVSQRYHELDAPSVPAALDERILQQARQARATPKPGPRWRQWGAPLAIAASAVIAVTVLLQISPQESMAPPQESVARSPSPSEPEPAPLAEAAAPPAVPTGGAAPAPERSLAEDAEATRNYATVGDTVEQQNQPARVDRARQQEQPQREIRRRMAADERLREEQMKRESEAREVEAERRAPEEPARSLPPPPPPPAAEPGAPVPSPTPIQSVSAARPAPPADKAKEEALQADRTTPPEKLLEQLRALRAQGKDEEAKALYKRLVEAHPTFQVPERDIPR